MTAAVQQLSERLPDILFYIFSTLSVIAAIQVLVRRNPMNAAVSMVVSVLSVAVIYLLLSAQFIAAAQMIVYAGAIVVLFIFVIMLLNLTEAEIGDIRFGLFKLFAAFVAVAMILSILPALRDAPGTAAPPPEAAYGTTKSLGRMLFGEFLLPFELTSVLILSAMVAGVVLAKRDVSSARAFSFIDFILDRVTRNDRGTGGKPE